MFDSPSFEVAEVAKGPHRVFILIHNPSTPGAEWFFGKWCVVCTPRVSVVFLALIIILYTKKLLNSDWPRKECKMCNMSAKCVIPVQKV